MSWKPVPAPPILKACNCGSEKVEKQSDGLVKKYRCADCGAFLGDITMGHEP